MKLYFYNSVSSRFPSGNFGDELNKWLWPNLIGELLDDRSSDFATLVGIGTILNDRIPQTVDAKLLVFGSGWGYGSKPAIDENWKVYCLRGPMTAKALGMDPALAVTDAALLVREVYKNPNQVSSFKAKTIFIPHFKSECESFRDVCELADIEFVSPSDDVERILKRISNARLVIAEAMHGAIVADALRVPWIAARTWPGVHVGKWMDWTSSMEMSYEPQDLFFRRISVANLNQHAIAWPILKRLVAHRLQTIAKSGREKLSEDSVCDRRLDQLLTALYKLKRDYSVSSSSAV